MCFKVLEHSNMEIIGVNRRPYNNRLTELHKDVVVIGHNDSGDLCIVCVLTVLIDCHAIGCEASVACLNSTSRVASISIHKVAV
jgi:hypothetical protein